MTAPTRPLLTADGGSAFSVYGDQPTISGGTASSTFDAVPLSGGTALQLAPYQIEYQGLVMGDGCDIGFSQITGLREAPPTRSGDVVRPRQHGSFAGRTLFAERTVVLTLEIFAPRLTTIDGALAQIAQAFANISDPALLRPLRFLLPGWDVPRVLYGRPTKLGTPIDVPYAHGKVQVPVEITCPDPLVYSSAIQQQTVNLPAPRSGVGFPAAFPLGFGGSTSALMLIKNVGNEASPPKFVFAGPLTNPQVYLGSVALGFGITLGVGDSLAVDCSAGSAVLNGTANRAGTITTGSQYFAVPVGESQVGFTAATAGGGGSCSITVASAWGMC